MFFSTDPHVRARRIFNTIAPVYSALDGYVKRGFKQAIQCIDAEIHIQDKSVLDVGTGPGAWAALFKEHGAGTVHGVDFAERMIHAARRKYHPHISFSVGDARNLHAFSDESFDIVTTSFMLHGVKEPVRAAMLLEMKRISRNHVLIHDYWGQTPPVARLLEYLEHSDYRHFKANFIRELRDLFSFVKMEDAAPGAAVYFAAKEAP
jgi:ubiquinone/menaquinone biosynthesis C-methylase UbiE